MLDKLTTRMPPPPQSLHKSAEVADHYLPSNGLLPCRCGKHWSACAVDQGLTAVMTFLGWWQRAVRHLDPTATGATKLVTGQGKSTTFKKPTFSRKPALYPVYKSSQAEPAPESFWRTFLPSVLPPLCSSISSIKFVWRFVWGFLSISILGNPRTATPVT